MTWSTSAGSRAVRWRSSTVTARARSRTSSWAKSEPARTKGVRSPAMMAARAMGASSNQTNVWCTWIFAYGRVGFNLRMACVFVRHPGVPAHHPEGPMKIVVVGGGAASLFAALLLARAQHDVVVLEQDQLAPAADLEAAAAA